MDRGTLVWSPELVGRETGFGRMCPPGISVTHNPKERTTLFRDAEGHEVLIPNDELRDGIEARTIEARLNKEFARG